MRHLTPAIALFALVAAFAGSSATAHAADDQKPVTIPTKPSEILPDRAKPKFEPSETTADAVQALQDRIAAYVEKIGPKYTFATSFNSDTGRIEIDTDAPADLMASLTKLDDPELQKEVDRTPRSASRGSRDVYNRRDDIPPFWGGAGLTDGAFLCSAGYAVRNAAGSVFSVSAGHCFANGIKALVESGLRSYGTRLRPAPADRDRRQRGTWSCSAASPTSAACTRVA